MSILTLLFLAAIFGFVIWLVLLIPMPPAFRSIIVGVAAVLLILWMLQALGVVTHFPRVRFP